MKTRLTFLTILKFHKVSRVDANHNKGPELEVFDEIKFRMIRRECRSSENYTIRKVSILSIFDKKTTPASFSRCRQRRRPTTAAAAASARINAAGAALLLDCRCAFNPPLQP